MAAGPVSSNPSVMLGIINKNDTTSPQASDQNPLRVKPAAIKGPSVVTLEQVPADLAAESAIDPDVKSGLVAATNSLMADWEIEVKIERAVDWILPNHAERNKLIEAEGLLLKGQVLAGNYLIKKVADAVFERLLKATLVLHQLKRPDLVRRLMSECSQHFFPTWPSAPRILRIFGCVSATLRKTTWIHAVRRFCWSVMHPWKNILSIKLLQLHKPT